MSRTWLGAIGALAVAVMTVIVVLAWPHSSGSSADVPELRDIKLVTTHGDGRDDPAAGNPAAGNPGRGLRYEISYDADDLDNPWDFAQSTDIRQVLAQLRRQYPGGGHVVRVNFYLWQFARGSECAATPATCTLPISRTALDNIALTLRRLRQLDFQAVVRFAYDDSVRPERCYSVDTIEEHLRQLRPVLARFGDVIQVLQAGFVGEWGDWNGSCLHLERSPDSVRSILGAVVAALPPGVDTQVTDPAFRKMVTDDDVASRIGYADDYFSLRADDHDLLSPQSSLWPEVLTIAPRVTSDGEMPWDTRQGPGPYAIARTLDGIRAARRMQSLHLTTFSLVHSAKLSVTSWRATPLTLREVTVAHLPVDDDWFRDAAGRPVRRTVFDYLRDHLGYRLVATGAAVGNADGDHLPVELKIRNYGFAAPQQPRNVIVVLLDARGAIVADATAGTDWTTWDGAAASEAAGSGVPPTNVVDASIDLRGVRPGRYRLGLAIPAPTHSSQHTAVRLANAGLGWLHGVNVLAPIRVR